jgi:hypothetical protein
MTTTIPETTQSGLILRDVPTNTLKDVLNSWDRKRSSWSGGMHNVSVRLQEDTPALVFGDHEIKVTDLGLEAMARFVGIPVNYLLKVPADEQQYMFDRRIERGGEYDLSVWFTSDGVEEIMPSGKQRIEPSQIAEAVSRVMPLESSVRDAWQTPNDLRLDVVVPLGFDKGWGGDRAIDDMTAGGVRVWQNRKQNLAPGVQPFAYRLRCTNGWEVQDLGIKVDARGLDVDEVLDAFEIEADRAFRRVEADIALFYDMRSHRVGGDRTGVLRQAALEAGLPARSVGLLENLVPSQLSGGDANYFDMVNLITNQANLSPTSGSARNLQQAGGSLINEHTARCPECHKRVN